MSFWFTNPEAREEFRESHGFPLPRFERLEGEEAIEALAPVVRRLRLPERSTASDIWDETYRRCHWEHVDLDLALGRIGATDGDMLLYDGGSEGAILRMATRDVLRALPHLRIGDSGPDLVMGDDGGWAFFVDYHDMAARGVGFVFRQVGG